MGYGSAISVLTLFVLALLILLALYGSRRFRKEA
jgi:LPXTG-motif cell wall-anchored protein